MLFNSYEFLFLFFPVTLVIYYFLSNGGKYLSALAWVVIASLFFYGWWNPAYLFLLCGSIVFNYIVGTFLTKNTGSNKKFSLLVFGVAANLFLLGYFKYANFFVNNINFAFGSNFHLETVILPLAISFFTFQQITYLVDAYRGITREYSFLHYCLFVTFFPQLIAGPIVHHNEMMPQFAQSRTFRLAYENLAIGLCIFMLGLFKKVVLADGIAIYATPTFNLAEAGIAPTFFVAWGATLAYTFQLYFDFSGYSDMAIGIARTFGIVLPLNFHSPYKAVNIIEFWRRWHMTLSRFLRDYVYVPLGGNRKGKSRRYVNLMITMFLGGLWHGAGWTFIAWGLLHGAYLVFNHAWHALLRITGFQQGSTGAMGRFISRFITFMAVVVAWVFFRAESMDAAMLMLQGMAGMNGYSLPATLIDKIGSAAIYLENAGVEFKNMEVNFDHVWLTSIVLVAIIAFIFPNTQQFTEKLQRRNDVKQDQLIRVQLKYNLLWLFVISVITFISIINISKTGEFLYFNF